MNMMSLLLATNTSTTEEKKQFQPFCQDMSGIPFLAALFAVFIVGAFLLLGILFYKSEKAGKIGLVLVAFIYIYYIILEFHAGHIGHGIIMIMLIVLIIGGGVLAVNFWGETSSEQKAENKAADDKKTSYETITMEELNNSVTTYDIENKNN